MGLIPLSIALLLVIAVVIAAYAAWASFIRYTNEVAVCQQVVDAANALTVLLSNAEANQRGFVLSGEDQYLQSYRAAAAAIPSTLDHLSQVVALNPGQAQRAQQLRPLIQLRVDALGDTIRLRQTEGLDAAVAEVRSNRGKDAIDRVRSLTAEIVREAEARETLYGLMAASRSRLVGLIAAGGAAGLLVLLSLATIRVHNGMAHCQSLIADLERSQEEGARTRNWLEATLSSIGDGVIATDSAGRVTMLNPVAATLTGWTQEQALGRTLDEIFHIVSEETGSSAENPVAKVLRDGGAADLANHTLLTSRDGGTFPVEDSAAPIHDASGKLLGVVLVFRDATPRRSAENAIRASEERFRLAARAVPGVYYDWNLATGEVYRSEGLHELLGFHPSEIPPTIGWWRSRIHPGDVPPTLAAGEFPARDTDRFAMEYRIAHKDGHWVDVVDRGYVVRDAAGNPVRIAGSSVDISEYKRMEAALRQSERIYRSIGESIDYGVWICDAEGRNIYASDSFLRLTGLTQEDCAGQGWGKALHPDDARPVLEAWRECVRAGQPWNREHRFRGTDGRYHWTLARGVPVRNEKGEITAWAGINLDIDDIKTVEQDLRDREAELRRANRDLQQFAYSASHDLQEPLRMIGNFSQLLVRSFGDQLAPAASTYVSFISEGTHRMRALLEDLLAYTSMMEGSQEPPAPVDLNAALRKAEENCRTAIQESRTELTSDLLPTVHGLEIHFVQLFQNLLSNSIKYRSEAPPRISISCERAGKEWRIAFADNGMGIDPRYHDKIFGLFKRLHGKTIPGTGIGLALCQRIVEQNGGRIWVESETGRGATFYFTLPAVESAGHTALDPVLHLRASEQ